jgi:hypothetical protein
MRDMFAYLHTFITNNSTAIISLTHEIAMMMMMMMMMIIIIIIIKRGSPQADNTALLS